MGYYKTASILEAKHVTTVNGQPVGLVPVAEGAIIEINDETIERMMGNKSVAFCFRAAQTRDNLRYACENALRVAAAGEKPI